MEHAAHEDLLDSFDPNFQSRKLLDHFETVLERLYRALLNGPVSKMRKMSSRAICNQHLSASDLQTLPQISSKCLLIVSDVGLQRIYCTLQGQGAILTHRLVTGVKAVGSSIYSRLQVFGNFKMLKHGVEGWSRI
jgi:hypothetical protein